MIILIGTGHVFNLSQALNDIFEEKQPEIICVELDNQRYQALTLKQKDPKAYKSMEKNVPILYKILARFQDSMAKEYGVTAGEEMLTAINYAQTHQLPVALIDMNAQSLFSRMLKSMSISEKFKLMFTGFGGFFINKKHFEKELDNIEKNFDKYIEEVGKKFPTIKRVLIDERNQHMVQQLIAASAKHERVVAVIGDGHIPGISQLLAEKEIKTEIIRLNELRKHKTDKPDSSTASFSVKYMELK